MKTPTMRHETEFFTISELLNTCSRVNVRMIDGRQVHLPGSLRDTVIEMSMNKYNAPEHAIANVSTGDGGVLVELFWLEAQE